MQIHHDAMLTTHAIDEPDSLAGWLGDAERRMREALEQSRSSSHQCLEALEALAQLRAFVEYGSADVVPVVTQGTLRVMLALPSGAPSRTVERSAARSLTSREVDVLRLIACGNSNKVIALTLSLSIRTVERHINNIYRKIDAQNKADATAWALRHHLV